MSPKYFGNEDPAMGPRPTIVNQAFAQRYYGNEKPLGKVFLTEGNARHEIIGVAAEHRTKSGAKGRSLLSISLYAAQITSRYISHESGSGLCGQVG